MLKNISIFFQILKIYREYFRLFLIEIYLYYTSSYPLVLFLKKVALANRKIRITIFPKTTGRPATDQFIVDKIIELKILNSTWGGQKIADELFKIGIKISKHTVLKYLEVYGLRTPPPLKTMRWSEFINNHKFKIGIDFTCILDLFGRQLFCFVILDLNLRELIHLRVTTNPNAIWLKQQMLNSFDGDRVPEICICDNDKIYGNWFKAEMEKLLGMKVHHIPFKTPMMNGRVERVHRSIKEECFDNVVPINLAQVNRVSRDYKHYFNNYRPHQGIDGKIPLKEKSEVDKIQNYQILDHLDGVISSFELENVA